MTLAREPLSPEALAALLRRQGFALDPATGATKVEAALATLGAMILPAETPEKTRGYRLYHDSLRRHLEQSSRFTDTLETMRRVLLAGATQTRAHVSLVSDQVPFAHEYEQLPEL